MKNLTPEQGKTVDEFREALKDIPEEHKDLLTLVRYLRARDFKIDAAEKLYRGSLAWRMEYKPHMINPRDIEKGQQ